MPYTRAFSRSTGDKMDISNEYGNKEQHTALLAVLHEFDAICRENGIAYSLHGGTLLGAVRNHEFIPWDDDADVSITRENYEKLVSVLPKYDAILDLSEGWVPHFIDSHKSGSTDVFIWDFISEWRISEKLKLLCLRFLQGMIKEELHTENFSLAYKIPIVFTYYIGKLFSREAKLRAYNRFSKNAFTGTKKNIHRSNDNFTAIAMIMDKNVMVGYEEVVLENNNFLMSSHYREVLELSYGKNYLTPPPENERKPQHTKG